MRTGKNKEIFEESGEVSFPSSDKLTSFIYDLLRDGAPAGEIEHALRTAEETTTEGETTFTNGWLAQYAKHLADRIRKL